MHVINNVCTKWKRVRETISITNLEKESILCNFSPTIQLKWSKLLQFQACSFWENSIQKAIWCMEPYWFLFGTIQNFPIIPNNPWQGKICFFFIVLIDMVLRSRFVNLSKPFVKCNCFEITVSSNAKTARSAVPHFINKIKCLKALVQIYPIVFYWLNKGWTIKSQRTFVKK